MLFLVVALPLEGKPLIRALSLKKDMASHPFPIYRGDGCCLVISGTGKVRSAMAVTWLQAWTRPAENEACWINYGFCGTDQPHAGIGKLVRAGKITDMDTGRDYYPDHDASFCGETIVLSCCARPMTARPPLWTRPFWCDMESAGFMEAASRFASANRIHVLKVVSDHLEEKSLPDKSALQALVEKQVPALTGLFLRLSSPWPDDAARYFPDELQPLVGQVCAKHAFTAAMRQQLQASLRHALARGLDPLPLLQGALQQTTAAKQEGKRLLAGLMRSLDG